MLKTFFKLATLQSLLFVSACSHNPSVGEQILSQSTNTKVIGEKWMNGQELVKEGTQHVKKGKSMIKKGKRLINKGNAEVNEGESMIRKGNKMMKKSESTFHEKFPDVHLKE